MTLAGRILIQKKTFFFKQKSFCCNQKQLFLLKSILLKRFLLKMETLLFPKTLNWGQEGQTEIGVCSVLTSNNGQCFCFEHSWICPNLLDCDLKCFCYDRLFGIVVSTSDCHPISPGFDSRLYLRNFSGSIGFGTVSTQPREENWVATWYEK